jgi:broad specificity phosphatase PhoE
LTTHNAARRPLTQRDIHEQIEALFRLDNEVAGETLLVRHAQPAINPEHENDPMLSCEGLRQAELLGDHLSDLWIDAIYTAPERRCFQTAKIVADVLQRPLTVIDGLADISFNREAAEGVSSAYAERFRRDPRWESLPGFESGSVFRRRAVAAIEGIISSHPAGRCAVISHTSVLNAYLGLLLCIPRDQFFSPDHAAISSVRHNSDKTVLSSLNHTSHLEASLQIAGLTPAFTGCSLPLTNR